jgi:hypothetical protein
VSELQQQQQRLAGAAVGCATRAVFGRQHISGMRGWVAPSASPGFMRICATTTFLIGAVVP